MSCDEAIQLEKGLEFARAALREIRNPDSTSKAHFSKSDRVSLEKKAKQELRLINRALHDHKLTNESATINVLTIDHNPCSHIPNNFISNHL
jgi:hypothetical protein